MKDYMKLETIFLETKVIVLKTLNTKSLVSSNGQGEQKRSLKLFCFRGIVYLLLLE